MKLNYIGKIRDPLHDTIPYTSPEKVIMDRPEFQRLRRIHQTAFIQYVFPGATHTRFEHSLGTMHLAGKLFDALLTNQKRIWTSLQSAYSHLPDTLQHDFMELEAKQGSLLETEEGIHRLEESLYLAQCLRFAALLHDCGHSPLSHSGERFMPSWDSFLKALPSLNLPSWLEKAFQKKGATKHSQTISIPHEIYTLLFIQRIFQYNQEFLDAKMGQDICAIIDPSVEPYPNGALAQSKMQSLFNEVISGEIDVDRMDYLLRDSQECGVVYGYFDIGRILDSISFYLNQSTGTYHLAIRRSGIPAYEDYLRARMSMYHQVYFHKTATACEAMLEQIKEQLNNPTFPLDLENYAKLDDHSIHGFFQSFCPQSNSSQIDSVRLVDSLLLNRKLWKRVYEESVPTHLIANTPSRCDSILSFLKEQKIPAQLVETTTNLTRFSCKQRDGYSKNKLKVMIKNVHSLRFLEPIENHCPLINREDEEFIIRRIFIPKDLNANQQIDTSIVQKLISERMIK